MRENLKNARKATGMTQQAMADKLGLTKYVVAFDGNMTICEDGTIYKKHRDGLWYVANGSSGGGYQGVTVKVGDRNKRFLVHRLVAETFIPNPLDLPQVNHIDGNKQNNCVENLEWCSCAYNVQHSKKLHAQRYLTNLKAIRKDRKIPIQKMSYALKLLQGRYADIENAVVRPDKEIAERIETYFGLSIDFLFSEHQQGEST